MRWIDAFVSRSEDERWASEATPAKSVSRSCCDEAISSRAPGEVAGAQQLLDRRLRAPHGVEEADARLDRLEVLALAHEPRQPQRLVDEVRLERAQPAAQRLDRGDAGAHLALERVVRLQRLEEALRARRHLAEQRELHLVEVVRQLLDHHHPRRRRARRREDVEGLGVGEREVGAEAHLGHRRERLGRRRREGGQRLVGARPVRGEEAVRLAHVPQVRLEVVQRERGRRRGGWYGCAVGLGGVGGRGGRRADERREAEARRRAPHVLDRPLVQVFRKA